MKADILRTIKPLIMVLNLCSTLALPCAVMGQQCLRYIYNKHLINFTYYIFDSLLGLVKRNILYNTTILQPLFDNGKPKVH